MADQILDLRGRLIEAASIMRKQLQDLIKLQEKNTILEKALDATSQENQQIKEVLEKYKG